MTGPLLSRVAGLGDEAGCCSEAHCDPLAVHLGGGSPTAKAALSLRSLAQQFLVERPVLSK